jgi:aryl-alcohol dehydrogenase-like predicted oxidoreductase
LKPTYRSHLSGTTGRFPRIIVGTAALGGLRGPVDRGEAVATLLDALAAGISWIDTAPAYGNAEELVGEALRRWSGPEPAVSTKVGKTWHDGQSFFDYRSVAIGESIRRSCARVGRDSLDCIFVHEPDRIPRAERADVVDAMTRVGAAGVAKSMGLGGGFGSHWDGLVESGQFSAAIFHSRIDAITAIALDSDVPRLRAAKMAVLGGSALHRGLLGDRGADYLARQPAWLEPSAIAARSSLALVAADAGLSLPTLAHRFLLSIAEVDSILIGPENRAQLRDTLDALGAGPLERDVFDAVCGCQR